MGSAVFYTAEQIGRELDSDIRVQTMQGTTAPSRSSSVATLMADDDGHGRMFLEPDEALLPDHFIFAGSGAYHLHMHPSGELRVNTGPEPDRCGRTLWRTPLPEGPGPFFMHFRRDGAISVWRGSGPDDHAECVWCAGMPTAAASQLQWYVEGYVDEYAAHLGLDGDFIVYRGTMTFGLYGSPIGAGGPPVWSTGTSIRITIEAGDNQTQPSRLLATGASLAQFEPLRVRLYDPFALGGAVDGPVTWSTRRGSVSGNAPFDRLDTDSVEYVAELAALEDADRRDRRRSVRAWNAAGTFGVDASYAGQTVTFELTVQGRRRRAARPVSSRIQLADLEPLHADEPLVAAFEPLSVRVTDQLDRPQPGVEVIFEVELDAAASGVLRAAIAGSESPERAIEKTDAAGVATLDRLDGRGALMWGSGSCKVHATPDDGDPASFELVSSLPDISGDPEVSEFDLHRWVIADEVDLADVVEANPHCGHLAIFARRVTASRDVIRRANSVTDPLSLRVDCATLDLGPGPDPRRIELSGCDGQEDVAFGHLPEAVMSSLRADWWPRGTGPGRAFPCPPWVPAGWLSDRGDPAAPGLDGEAGHPGGSIVINALEMVGDAPRLALGTCGGAGARGQAGAPGAPGKPGLDGEAPHGPYSIQSTQEGTEPASAGNPPGDGRPGQAGGGGGQGGYGGAAGRLTVAVGEGLPIEVRATPGPSGPGGAPGAGGPGGPPGRPVRRSRPADAAADASVMIAADGADGATGAPGGLASPGDPAPERVVTGDRAEAIAAMAEDVVPSTLEGRCSTVLDAIVTDITVGASSDQMAARLGWIEELAQHHGLQGVALRCAEMREATSGPTPLPSDLSRHRLAVQRDTAEDVAERLGDPRTLRIDSPTLAGARDDIQRWAQWRTELAGPVADTATGGHLSQLAAVAGTPFDAAMRVHLTRAVASLPSTQRPGRHLSGIGNLVEAGGELVAVGEAEGVGGMAAATIAGSEGLLVAGMSNPVTAGLLVAGLAVWFTIDLFRSAGGPSAAELERQRQDDLAAFRSALLEYQAGQAAAGGAAEGYSDAWERNRRLHEQDETRRQLRRRQEMRRRGVEDLLAAAGTRFVGVLDALEPVEDGNEVPTRYVAVFDGLVVPTVTGTLTAALVGAQAARSTAFVLTIEVPAGTAEAAGLLVSESDLKSAPALEPQRGLGAWFTVALRPDPTGSGTLDPVLRYPTLDPVEGIAWLAAEATGFSVELLWTGPLGPAVAPTEPALARTLTVLLQLWQEETETSTPSKRKLAVLRRSAAITRVQVENVGQGAFHLLSSEAGVLLSHDIGSGRPHNEAAWLGPALRLLADSRAPLVISHWDRDHYRLLLTVAGQRVQRQNPVLAPSYGIWGPASALVAHALQSRGKLTLVGSTTVRRVNAMPRVVLYRTLSAALGRITLPANVTLAMTDIQARPGRRIDKNNVEAIVCRVGQSDGGLSPVLLLPGDASFQYIPRRHRAGLTLLEATHHGSARSVAGAVGRAAIPLCPSPARSTLVFSYGAGNQHGHDAATVAAFYAAKGWTGRRLTTAADSDNRGAVRLDLRPFA